jgi:hypothetical protein
VFVRSDGRATVRLEASRLSDLVASSSSSSSAVAAEARQALADLVQGGRGGGATGTNAECLPALVAVRRGRVVNAIAGYHRSWCDPATGALVRTEAERWLDRSGVLVREPPPLEDELCHLRPEERALLDATFSSSASAAAAGRGRGGAGDGPFYDCGLEGCRKTYPHQHVGMDENAPRFALDEPELGAAAKS